MELKPATRENIASGVAKSLEQMAEFFGTAKDWLGTHHVEVYNPVLRTFNTLVRSLFIAGGGIVGGFVLARLFPDFLMTRRAPKKPARRRINVSEELGSKRSYHTNSTFNH